jgi:hypothetical protein
VFPKNFHASVFTLISQKIIVVIMAGEFPGAFAWGEFSKNE